MGLVLETVEPEFMNFRKSTVVFSLVSVFYFGWFVSSSSFHLGSLKTIQGSWVLFLVFGLPLFTVGVAFLVLRRLLGAGGEAGTPVVATRCAIIVVLVCGSIWAVQAIESAMLDRLYVRCKIDEIPRLHGIAESVGAKVSIQFTKDYYVVLYSKDDRLREAFTNALSESAFVYADDPGDLSGK
jgi:hypothetical protein